MPNKRMHATRDTNDVTNSKGVGGRVMRGVRLLLRYRLCKLKKCPRRMAAGRGQSGASHAGQPALESGGQREA
jgi:hypothetical protein